MKGWVALVVLAVAAVVTVLVLAIVRTHDQVPERLARCIENSDAAVIAGPDLLGPLRADLAGGMPPKLTRRYRLGEDDAVLLTGSRYRILVVPGRDGPPLDGDIALRVFERTSDFAVIGVERDPLKGVLAACASLEA